MDTRAMKGADIASDHHLLVRSKIKLKLKRKQKNKAIRKKFDIIKLQQPAIKAHFSLKLCNKYDILQNSSRSTGVQKEMAKTMDQLGVVAASRREKTNIEQSQTGLSRING